MTGRLLLVLDGGLPGAGLLLGGHLGWGVGLVLPAGLLLGAGLIVIALFPAPGMVLLPLLALYGVLSATALGRRAWLARRARIDPAKVRELHRQACTAYLQHRSAEGLVQARALVRAAPEEAGAWRFLALVAADAGEAGLAAKATRRAQRIEDR